MCFSSDGHNLATACSDGVMRVFKLDASNKSFKFVKIILPDGGHMKITQNKSENNIIFQC